MDQCEPRRLPPGRRRETPVAREPDDLAGGAVGVMKGRAVAVRQMIVVLIESAVEAKAAVEHEGANERAGPVTGPLGDAGERRRALVEPKTRVVVYAVVVRQEPREDRCMRRQRERH